MNASALPPPRFGDPTEVVGRRIGAYILDAALTALVVLAIATMAFLAKADTTDYPSGRSAIDACESINDADTSPDRTCVPINSTTYVLDEDGSVSLFLQMCLAFVVVTALNTLLLQGVTGGSVGKLLVGLRVARPDGRRASFGQAIVRYLLLYIDAVIVFILPGLIFLLATKGHRRLGDMAAGTFVVDKDRLGSPIVPGVASQEAFAYGARTHQAYPSPGSGWPGGGGAAGPHPGPPAPWVPPPGPSAPTPSTTAATPSGDGPTWDEARQAYIQWDANRKAWVQWDDQAKSWGPISQ